MPLHVEGSAKIPNLGTAAGRRMLVPASPFQARQTAAFHAEKRLYAVYFNCPYEEIDDVKLHGSRGVQNRIRSPSQAGKARRSVL